jgi:hypothetical protein
MGKMKSFYQFRRSDFSNRRLACIANGFNLGLAPVHLFVECNVSTGLLGASCILLLLSTLFSLMERDNIRKKLTPLTVGIAATITHVLMAH